MQASSGRASDRPGPWQNRWLRPLSIRVAPTSRLVTVAGARGARPALRRARDRHRQLAPPPATPVRDRQAGPRRVRPGRRHLRGQRRRDRTPPAHLRDPTPTRARSGRRTGPPSRSSPGSSRPDLGRDRHERGRRASRDPGGGLSEVGGISWSPDSRRVAFGAPTTVGDARQRPVTTGASISPRPTDRAPAGWARPTSSGLPRAGRPMAGIAFKRVYPCCGAARRSLSLGHGCRWNQCASVSRRRRSSTAALVGTTRSGTPPGRRTAIGWHILADGIPPPGDDPVVNAAYDVYVINADGTHEQNITEQPGRRSIGRAGRRMGRGSRSRGCRPCGRGPGPRAMSLRPLDSHIGTLVVANPDGSNPIPMQGPAVDSAVAGLVARRQEAARLCVRHDVAQRERHRRVRSVGADCPRSLSPRTASTARHGNAWLSIPTTEAEGGGGRPAEKPRRDRARSAPSARRRRAGPPSSRGCPRTRRRPDPSG